MEKFPEPGTAGPGPEQMQLQGKSTLKKERERLEGGRLAITESIWTNVGHELLVVFAEIQAPWRGYGCSSVKTFRWWMVYFLPYISVTPL